MTAKKQGPLTDVGEGFRKQRCWHAAEKSVATAIRLLAFHQVSSPCACGALEGCFVTGRVSLQELADMCGDDLSKRSVQRVLRVLGDPLKAGVVTVHREKTEQGVNERNWYTFHSARWLCWTGKQRPHSWDPPHSETASPASPGLGVRAEALRLGRLASGLPAFDPKNPRLGRDAVKADRWFVNQARGEAALAARRPRVSALISHVKTCLTQGEAYLLAHRADAQVRADLDGKECPKPLGVEPEEGPATEAGGGRDTVAEPSGPKWLNQQAEPGGGVGTRSRSPRSPWGSIPTTN